MIPSLRAAAVAATILLTASCASRHSAANVTNAHAQTVRTATVRTIAFSTPLELSGSISAVREAAVGSVTAGRVVEIYVRTGDRVKAGQPIGRIDDSEYRASFAQAQGSAVAAEANVGRAQAQARAAQARMQLAGVTARRMATLYRQGAISSQQNDEAQADLASARATLAQAKAEIGAARGSRSEANAAVTAASVPLDEVLVRAPFDGVVIARTVDPGAVVGAGSPIATIQDETHLELDVSVPEDDVAGVHAGMSVGVRIDALGRSLPAHVRSVIAAQNPALRAALLEIDVAPAGALMPGMFARVAIAGPKHLARAVPTTALVRRSGQDGVFAIEDSRATFVPVQTGSMQNGWIEVDALPSGIDRVAIDGVAGLTDGASVAIAR